MSIDLEEIQRNQVLAKNIGDRLAYNEKQHTWKLEGPLTGNEYRAIRQALQVFDEWAYKALYPQTETSKKL